MSQQKMRDAWVLLMFRVKPHSEQTRRFALPLQGFTNRELVRMSPVMPQTLAAMRYFLPSIPPKNQTEFRRQLAYLTELRDRQAEAWAAAIADTERNLAELEKTILTWA